MHLIGSNGGDKIRTEWVKELKEFVPNLEVLPSVDGFNKEKVETELAQLQVPFKWIEHWNYGALSCWMSHYKAFKKQVDEKIPFMVCLEDDVVLNETFYPGVNALQHRFEKDKELNIIRFGGFGEGYMTSFDSASRLLKILTEKGVIQNIDNQLRCHSGKEVHIPLIHWLRCPTNCGDIGKTERLPDNFAFLAGMRAAQHLLNLPQERPPKPPEVEK